MQSQSPHVSDEAALVVNQVRPRSGSREMGAGLCVFGAHSPLPSACL
jgi:hypothetical protein